MQVKHVLSLSIVGVLIAIGSYIILSDNKAGSAADVDETERNEKKRASQQLIQSILKEQLNPLLMQTNNDKTEIIEQKEDIEKKKEVQITEIMKILKEFNIKQISNNENISNLNSKYETSLNETASYNESQSVDVVKTKLIEYKQASQEMVENNIKTKIKSSMDNEANIIQQQDDENKKPNDEKQEDINEQQQASKEMIENNIIKIKIESPMNTETNIIQQQDDENKKQNVEDEAEINEQQQASKIIIKDDFEPKTIQQQDNEEENKQNDWKMIKTFIERKPSDSNIDNVSNLNSKWDVESYQKQFSFHDDGVYGKFIDNDQVILYGKGSNWSQHYYVFIKKENNEKSFKCKLIKLPNQSDVETDDSKDYKLCFGLFHKYKKENEFMGCMYFQFDAFDILNGQIQDIDYVFYKKQDDKDYNDASYYKLNGKIFQNTQYNTNDSWDKNWYNDKIKEGDIFELIIKEKEKKLILIINDKEAAHLIVKADYPINKVHVGFKFHIYPTKKPTIIQIL